MKNQKPFVIGITGGSGSGKTSIIKLLRKAFPKNHLALISQDDYYKAREEQIADKNGVTNFDLPTCLQEDKFLSDIESLIAGNPITIKEYTFNNDLAESRDIIVDSAPIIIVEGLFVFYYPKMRDLMDLKIYVDASEETKLKRRIQRDRVERNYPLEDVMYRYEHHVTPAYNEFILPFKRQADIVINNEFTYDAAVEMVIGFIKEKVQS